METTTDDYIEASSDEVEIIVRTKENLTAKLVNLAEDEGEKVAVIEFENGKTQIKKMKCIVMSEDPDMASDEVTVEVRTKSHRGAKLLMQAEDEGELVALIRYEDTGETRLTRQISRGSSRSRSATRFGNMQQRNRVGELPKVFRSGGKSRRTKTQSSQSLLEISEKVKKEWTCNNCRFRNLDSSAKCLMCRRPNKSRMSRQIADRLIVKGRIGVNSAITGCYEKIEDLFGGRVCYIHAESDWVIFWSRKADQWIFDCRGFMNDEKGCACSDQDVDSPQAVTQDWLVYTGTKWEEDARLQIDPWIELDDEHFNYYNQD